jgi:predicted alpha/beta hydrolase
LSIIENVKIVKVSYAYGINIERNQFVKVLRAYLEKAGFEVLTAYRGDSGLSLWVHKSQICNSGFQFRRYGWFLGLVKFDVKDRHR